MNIVISKKESDLISTEEINRIYKNCYNGRPSGLGYLKEYGLPKFEELYEEYVSARIELDTRVEKEEFANVKIRKTEFGDFDVEHGFRPEQLGYMQEHQFMIALNYYGYSYSMNGVVMNEPHVEVW